MNLVASRLLLCFTIALAVAAPVRSQPASDRSARLRRALVTPDAAYLTLPPELVCGPEVVSVSPSPLATDALIVRRAAPPPRTLAAVLESDNDGDTSWQWLQTGQGETQLLLWGTGSRRAATVWRRSASVAGGYAEVRQMQWIADSSVALVRIQIVHGPLTPDLLKRVYNDGPKVTQTFLRLNARNGSVETLADAQPNDAHLVMHPNGEWAAIATNDGATLSMIEPKGALGVPITVPLNAAHKERGHWSGMREGRRVHGAIMGYDPEGKYYQRNVMFDIVTGAMTKFVPEPLPPVPPARPAPLVPYVVRRKPAPLTHRTETLTATALWIEGHDPATTKGQDLLTANADPTLHPAELTTSVLYGQHGALWATPLLKVPTAEFLAERQAQYKRDALDRAARISLVLSDLRHDKQTLPTREMVKEYLMAQFPGDPNVLCNPATGKPGFTPAYTSLHLGDYPKPKEAVFGYLQSEGGRVAIYMDGHFTWEDAPSQP